MWCISVKVEQETSAPPPKKNPGSAIVRGAYSPYFGIPGEELMENIIDKIMTMLVSGFNHK